jgi:hypothetical protein
MWTTVIIVFGLKLKLIKRNVERSKAKIKLSLCLTNYTPRHDDVWKTGGKAPPFLTSALVGGEYSASCPVRFTPGDRATGTHCVGDWVGSRAGLNDEEK